MGHNMNYRELKIYLPGSAKEPVTERLMNIGCLGTIEQKHFIIAYFSEPADTRLIEDELNALGRALIPLGRDVRITVEARVIAGEDWNRTWKAGFKPLDVGERFTVLPPWEEKRPGRMNILIDPGMAFGTGHHETTRSCLALIERYAYLASGTSSFLDLGTGTGLLAIAASRLGYRRIVAVDTDPEAIEAARKNIDLNAPVNMELIEGDLSRSRGTFDLIAANLISGVLISLAPEIAARLNPSGLAILSGILNGQEKEVIAAMVGSGLILRETVLDGKWISLVMSVG